MSGPCGFRPFHFHSILKIENQNFTIVIFNVWFLKNWKSNIYNLNFQFLLLRKVKLNIILQYFENQKLKIENGQLVVLTFCFQFPLPKIQAIKNSNLNKAIHVQQTARNGVTAGWNPKYWKIILIFVFMKNQIANRPKIPVMEGEGKTGSGATANKMAVVLKWRSVLNLVPRVSSLSRRPWGRGWECSVSSSSCL